MMWYRKFLHILNNEGKLVECQSFHPTRQGYNRIVWTILLNNLLGVV